MTVAQAVLTCSVSRVPTRTTQTLAAVNAAELTILNWTHDVRPAFCGMAAAFFQRLRLMIESEVNASRRDTSAGSWQGTNQNPPFHY